jgi:RHS repeat-associated protein
MSRTTEFRYNVDGLLEELLCRNGAQEQVTRWEYGVDAATGSKVARADLLRAKIYPDGAEDRVEYTYNRLGEAIHFKDQNATEHVYEYDALGRVIFDKVPVLDTAKLDGSIRALGSTYNIRGEVENVTSYSNVAGTTAVNQVGFTYNGFGQVTAERQQVFSSPTSSETVGYEYADADGLSNSTRRTSVNYPSSKVITYSYDTIVNEALSRLSDIVDTTSTPKTLATYSWLGASTPVRTLYPLPGSGLEMSSITAEGQPLTDAGDPYASLDRFGRLQEVWWRRDSSTREQVQYGFDRVGNIRWRHNLTPDSGERFDEAYQYNGLYELQNLGRGMLNQNRTAIGARPNWQESWQYDEIGNWLGYETAAYEAPEEPVVELNQTRSYNAANELLTINGTNAMLAHDPAGNMTRVPKAGAWNDGASLVQQELLWDAWNRLTSASSGSGGLLRRGQYKYDALHRRIYKTTRIGFAPQVHRNYYYSDQWQVLEEQVASSGTVERQFVWGVMSIDDLILRERYPSGVLSDTHYALSDGKDVTVVTDDDGVAVERYAYHGFGFSEVLNGLFEPVDENVSTIEWETRFCGYRWDVESALYQVRLRYLHPCLGRWLSRDPMENLALPNLYTYVLNDPLNNLDEFGDIDHKTLLKILVEIAFLAGNIKGLEDKPNPFPWQPAHEMKEEEDREKDRRRRPQPQTPKRVDPPNFRAPEIRTPPVARWRIPGPLLGAGLALTPTTIGGWHTFRRYLEYDLVATRKLSVCLVLCIYKVTRATYAGVDQDHVEELRQKRGKERGPFEAHVSFYTTVDKPCPVFMSFSADQPDSRPLQGKVLHHGKNWVPK